MSKRRVLPEVPDLLCGGRKRRGTFPASPQCLMHLTVCPLKCVPATALLIFPGLPCASSHPSSVFFASSSSDVGISSSFGARPPSLLLSS